MISLPAVVLLAATSSASALAGVTLGAPLAEVRAAHPDAQSYAHSRGTLWTWKRPGGGTVDVSVDAKGVVTSIDFTADPGEKGTIDLPCAGAFGIEGSHVNLDFAMESTPCKRDGIATYDLPGT